LDDYFFEAQNKNVVLLG